MQSQLSIIIIVFILCIIATQSTSKSEGVSWNEKRNLWQFELYINGQRRKFYFDNEFDATKKLNDFSYKMEIPSQNLQIYELPNEKKDEKKSQSQYKGVHWHRQTGKWYALICPKGKKPKYGGSFTNELDAAERVHQLREKFGITSKNCAISTIPNEKYRKKAKKTSQYKGVYWHRENRKWYAQIHQKGRKQKFGGYFKDELDAAKRVNQLCEEFGILLQNPEISAIPKHQYQYQKKEKTSQFKGVSWHVQMGKWYVRIYRKGQKPKYEGFFEDELDAAKRGNQLCEELGIPLPNPEIGAKPKQPYEKKQKTSRYKGVYWRKKKGKWYTQLRLKGESKCGGYFEDELDAGKRVNQLCEEFGIASKNPEISALPNQQNQYQKKTRHRNIKEFTGAEKKENGVFS